MYCPCPNSQQADQSALGTKDTNKLSYSTERHQIHDDVQGGLLGAKVVETLQKRRRVKKLMEKRMVACPKCQGKIRVSVGVWRLKAEGQAQVNFPIAAVTLGSVICFCKLLLGHISFCLLSFFFFARKPWCCHHMIKKSLKFSRNPTLQCLWM